MVTPRPILVVFMRPAAHCAGRGSKQRRAVADLRRALGRRDGNGRPLRLWACRSGAAVPSFQGGLRAQTERDNAVSGERQGKTAQIPRQVRRGEATRYSFPEVLRRASNKKTASRRGFLSSL
jgi:hypothetical protein